MNDEEFQKRIKEIDAKIEKIDDLEDEDQIKKLKDECDAELMKLCSESNLDFNQLKELAHKTALYRYFFSETMPSLVVYAGQIGLIIMKIFFPEFINDISWYVVLSPIIAWYVLRNF